VHLSCELNRCTGDGRRCIEIETNTINIFDSSAHHYSFIANILSSFTKCSWTMFGRAPIYDCTRWNACLRTKLRLLSNDESWYICQYCYLSVCMYVCLHCLFALRRLYMNRRLIYSSCRWYSVMQQRMRLKYCRLTTIDMCVRLPCALWIYC